MIEKTTWQDIVSKTRNLKDNLFTTASKIRIGDNVWEHNVVSSIVKGKNKIIFNSDNATVWEAVPNQQVMITARIPKNNFKTK